MWSCSSSDEPKTEQSPKEGSVTQSELTAKVVDHPWEVKDVDKDCTLVLSDGTSFSMSQNPITGSSNFFLWAMYFTPERCTYFYHPDSPTGDNYFYTRNSESYNYDVQTGILTINKVYSEKKLYVESVSDTTLVVRDNYGALPKEYPGDVNLMVNTEVDPGSYRRIVYHRISESRYQELLSQYQQEK